MKGIPVFSFNFCFSSKFILVKVLCESLHVLSRTNLALVMYYSITHIVKLAILQRSSICIKIDLHCATDFAVTITRTQRTRTRVTITQSHKAYWKECNSGAFGESRIRSSQNLVRRGPASPVTDLATKTEGSLLCLVYF